MGHDRLGNAAEIDNSQISMAQPSKSLFSPTMPGTILNVLPVLSSLSLVMT